MLEARAPTEESVCKDPGLAGAKRRSVYGRGLEADDPLLLRASLATKRRMVVNYR